MNISLKKLAFKDAQTIEPLFYDYSRSRKGRPFLNVLEFILL